MSEQVVEVVEVKKHWYSNFPKWLRITLLVVSIITVIYWGCLLIYKSLKAFRRFGVFFFDERNYWTFLTCILILLVGSLLIAQFALGLDPFGNFADWVAEKIDDTREAIKSLF